MSMPDSPIILALNGGSSSIRFAVYQQGAVLERKLSGKLDRIGRNHSTLKTKQDANSHHLHKGIN